MKLVIQRVSEASVEVDGRIVGEIGRGLMVLLGIHREDSSEAIAWLVKKLTGMRIFSDASGKFNESIKDIGGSILVVSQFTLYGNCNNGRRPDFLDAAPPDRAVPLYKAFLDALSATGVPVQSGEFGASMRVALVNEGPVTLVLER